MVHAICLHFFIMLEAAEVLTFLLLFVHDSFIDSRWDGGSIYYYNFHH